MTLANEQQLLKKLDMTRAQAKAKLIEMAGQGKARPTGDLGRLLTMYTEVAA